MARVVAEVNRRPRGGVRRFAVLERDFLPEKGELTPTLKVKRRVVEDHSRDEIGELYAPPRTGLRQGFSAKPETTSRTRPPRAYGVAARGGRTASTTSSPSDSRTSSEISRSSISP